MSRKKKCHSFLLLEVLIACSLIGLVVTHFIGQGGRLYKAQFEALKAIESDRIAAWTFTEIYEQFAKGELHWAQIPPLKQKSASFPLPPAPIQLSPFRGVLNRSFTLETMRQKEQNDGTLARLVCVHLKVHKKTFTYRFTAVKKLG